MSLMNLVAISENCLVNPRRIGCVEQVIEQGKVVLYIWVDGIRYLYQYSEKVPIEQFLNVISEVNRGNDKWVG